MGLNLSDPDRPWIPYRLQARLFLVACVLLTGALVYVAFQLVTR